jgi:glycosyltransferase involved in cell wall biosynthesis
MKIIIYDNFVCSPMEGRGAAGGLEKVAKDDAFNLTKAGHDVIFLYAGEVPEWDFPFRIAQVNPVSKEEAIEKGLNTIAWQNTCVKNAITLIKNHKPDVMLYHSHTMSPAKKIIQGTGIPTLITLHGFLTGNLFIDSGRITAYEELKRMGALLVTNTQTTGIRLWDQAIKARSYVKKPVDHKAFVDIVEGRIPFFDDYIRTFMFVEEDFQIVAHEDYAIIASRADPLKQVQKFKNIEYPTRIFWKDFPTTTKDYPAWLEKQVNAFLANRHIWMRMNSAYSDIMDAFSKAKACIISWPDETFGLTAFEAAQKGVPCIVMHRGEPNCTQEFLSQVSPPMMFDYRDKDYLEKVISALQTMDSGLNTRREYAANFKKRFSYANWLTEKEGLMRKAIDKMGAAGRTSNSLFDLL